MESIAPAPSDRSWLFIAISLAFALLAFWPVLGAGFVNIDDDDYVTSNEAIRSFGNVGLLLTQPVQGNYHPLTMLSLAANHAISGESATSFHLVNLLLHLANTCLVFRLAARLSRNNDLVAFATALLFAVHPMHVESVAWVAERKDVLYTFFYLLGLASYDKFVASSRRSSYFASLLWFVLSLASKPAAVVFPIALVAWDFFRGRKLSVATLTEKVPFFALALVGGWLTLHGQAAEGATDVAQLHGLETRALFASYGFMMYLAKLVWPVHLSVFYPMPAVGESLSFAYQAAPAVFAAVLVACALTVRKHPVVTCCFAFFLIHLLLVLQLKVVGSAIIADRYTYVPYLGLFFLAGWLLDRCVQRKQLAFAAVLGVGTILAVVSNQQARAWENSGALWDNAIAHAPSARAYVGRAKAHRSEGNFKAALTSYDRALQLRESAELYTGRAGVHVELDEHALALADYDKALAIDPRSAPAFAGRGALFSRMGKLDQAIQDLSEALRLDPTKKTTYRNRALSFMKRNEHEKAIADFKTYLIYAPSDAEVRNGIGVCYQKLQKYESSLEFFDSAILLNRAPSYFLNRSYSWSALGKTEEAKRDALQAKQLGLQVPEAYARSLGLAN
ncbi:MAG TPA: tetratricopeptide repeat protein [Planctomycetota bacterium]|nr:tetratricopeptide repeat protein [Planctomycetota bacterium]